MNAIICAAVRDPSTGTVITGFRHFDHHIRYKIEYNGLKFKDFTEEGFVDMYGEYHNREDALKIVLDNGQHFLKERNGCSSRLYSEGIY